MSRKVPKANEKRNLYFVFFAKIPNLPSKLTDLISKLKDFISKLKGFFSKFEVLDNELTEICGKTSKKTCFRLFFL